MSAPTGLLGDGGSDSVAATCTTAPLCTACILYFILFYFIFIAGAIRLLPLALPPRSPLPAFLILFYLFWYFLHFFISWAIRLLPLALPPRVPGHM
jgi:energy-coupling factor transporter transmembrane protein EcfT